MHRIPCFRQFCKRAMRTDLLCLFFVFVLIRLRKHNFKIYISSEGRHFEAKLLLLLFSKSSLITSDTRELTDFARRIWGVSGTGWMIPLSLLCFALYFNWEMEWRKVTMCMNRNLQINWSHVVISLILVRNPFPTENDYCLHFLKKKHLSLLVYYFIGPFWGRRTPSKDINTKIYKTNHLKMLPKSH